MRGWSARAARTIGVLAVLCVAVPARAEDGLAVRAEVEISMDPAAMASVVADVAHLAESYGFAVRVEFGADGAVDIRTHLIDMTVLGTGSALEAPATLRLVMSDGPFQASEREMEDWIRALDMLVAARDGLQLRVLRPAAAADGPRRWSLPPIKIVRIAADRGGLIAAIDAVAAFGDETGLAVRKTPDSVGGMAIQMYALDMSVVGVLSGGPQAGTLALTVADGVKPASGDNVNIWVRDLTARLSEIAGVTLRIEAGH
jgi:hypothetical protein